MTDLTHTELRALETRIAAHLGWTDIRHAEYYEESRLYDGFVKALRGTDKNGSSEILPHWSTNAGDALELVASLYAFSLWTEPGRKWVAGITAEHTHIRYDGEATTPSAAICLAWLAYKDAEAQS